MRNCHAAYAWRRTDSLLSAAYSSQISKDIMKPHLVTLTSTVSIKLCATFIIDCSKFLLCPMLVFYFQQYSSRELHFNSICCLLQVNFNKVSVCWCSLPLIVSTTPDPGYISLPTGAIQSRVVTQKCLILIAALAVTRGHHCSKKDSDLLNKQGMRRKSAAGLAGSFLSEWVNINLSDRNDATAFG